MAGESAESAIASETYRQTTVYQGRLEPTDANAPKFDGRNITEFLEEYCFECDRAVTWADFQTELKSLYAGQDENRKRGTRVFIENYVREV
ncbi:hypothetical protein COCCADRAFT_112308, partial [Bipolaris zeicola 26-R-13]